MNDFLKILGGGIAGFITAKLLSSDTKESKENKNNDYFVYIKTEDFDKHSLLFKEYDEAKKMFDKIVKNKEIEYKDIIDNSESEKELYDKWLKDELKDIPKLTDKSEVYLVIIGKGNEDFEKKEL